MPETFPSSMPVKALDLQHPRYHSTIDAWRKIDWMVRGGHCIKEHVRELLQQRPKELGDVYSARCSRLTYQNIIGTALGWYQAALFNDTPETQLADTNDKEITKDSVIGEWYADFLTDCNRAGQSYVEFWRARCLDMLKFGGVFVLTDLPRIDAEDGAFGSLADQKQLGALNPYLVAYDPTQVINWDCDDYGNLNSIVISMTEMISEFGQEPKVIDCWYYFDRQNFAEYEAPRDPKSPNKKAEYAYLKASGPHALANENRVPVRWVQLPNELWLADRAYLQALCHLNADNAYDWALFMSCLPIPVIKGDYKADINISEVAFIQLEENGEFNWTEPAGNSFAHTATRIQSLREEIYRQMHLQAQARDSSSTASAQSGISKQADMMPAREVMSSLGDIIRQAMQNTLNDVAAIRSDEDLKFTVLGFDFDDDDLRELADDQAVLDMGIPSNTFRKELQKRVVRRKMRDARPELIQTMESEIESSPDPAEQNQQQMGRMFSKIIGYDPSKNPTVPETKPKQDTAA
jgi:hypothetical protein